MSVKKGKRLGMIHQQCCTPLPVQQLYEDVLGISTYCELAESHCCRIRRDWASGARLHHEGAVARIKDALKAVSPSARSSYGSMSLRCKN